MLTKLKDFFKPLEFGRVDEVYSKIDFYMGIMMTDDEIIQWKSVGDWNYWVLEERELGGNILYG